MKRELLVPLAIIACWMLFAVPSAAADGIRYEMAPTLKTSLVLRRDQSWSDAEINLLPATELWSIIRYEAAGVDARLPFAVYWNAQKQADVKALGQWWVTAQSAPWHFALERDDRVDGRGFVTFSEPLELVHGEGISRAGANTVALNLTYAPGAYRAVVQGARDPNQNVAAILLQTDLADGIAASALYGNTVRRGNPESGASTYGLSVDYRLAPGRLGIGQASSTSDDERGYARIIRWDGPLGSSYDLSVSWTSVSEGFSALLAAPNSDLNQAGKSTLRARLGWNPGTALSGQWSLGRILDPTHKTAEYTSELKATFDPATSWKVQAMHRLAVDTYDNLTDQEWQGRIDWNPLPGFRIVGLAGQTYSDYVYDGIVHSGLTGARVTALAEYTQTFQNASGHATLGVLTRAERMSALETSSFDERVAYAELLFRPTAHVETRLAYVHVPWDQVTNTRYPMVYVGTQYTMLGGARLNLAYKVNREKGPGGAETVYSDWHAQWQHQIGSLSVSLGLNVPLLKSPSGGDPTSAHLGPYDSEMPWYWLTGNADNAKALRDRDDAPKVTLDISLAF